MTDEDIIDRLLKFEGGYVSHPNDRGGPTNFGITLATLQAWRGPGSRVTAADVQHMPRDEARAIYRKQYIAGPGFDRIESADLRMVLVDCAVLYGPKRSVIWLQTAVKIGADGLLGPQTCAAVNKADARKTGRAVLAQRYRRIAERVEESPTQRVFLAGWMSRTDQLSQFC